MVASFTNVRKNENPLFQDYTISSGRGTATLTLHRALEPTLRSALRLQEDYRFEDPKLPIEIQAFYREGRLVGFRDLDTPL